MTVSETKIKPILFQEQEVKEVEIHLKNKNKEGFDTVYITTDEPKNMINVAFQDSTEGGRAIETWKEEPPYSIVVTSTDSFVGIVEVNADDSTSLSFSIPVHEIELIKATDGSLY